MNTIQSGFLIIAVLVFLTGVFLFGSWAIFGTVGLAIASGILGGLIVAPVLKYKFNL